jgi:hypothetical protein
MRSSTGEQKPPSVEDRVRVVQQSIAATIKLRRYQVVKANSRFDLLELEWADAPPDSKESYQWTLADYVRLA